MAGYDKAFLRDLYDGKLSDEEVRKVQMAPKDPDRFQKYVGIYQEKVNFRERILMRIGEHLCIVEKGDQRIVKCDCGHEYGDYRVNWKLSALILVRQTSEDWEEIGYFGISNISKYQWQELREFICPGCGSLLEVEAVPRYWPITFDFLPDIDGFYADWLGQPLKTSMELKDKTGDVTGEWAKEPSPRKLSGS